ncbi:MAG TPA: hypothetical protein VJM47_09575 [Nitrosospira sp.]|nr:hypothetical protein [Nitrosospira sp.]
MHPYRTPAPSKLTGGLDVPLQSALPLAHPPAARIALIAASLRKLELVKP